MKRRFVALLAVPAVALGFTIAPANTDTAQALYPHLDAMSLYCGLQGMALIRAENANDWVTYDQIWAQSAAAGCLWTN